MMAEQDSQPEEIGGRSRETLQGFAMGPQGELDFDADEFDIVLGDGLESFDEDDLILDSTNPVPIDEPPSSFAGSPSSRYVDDGRGDSLARTVAFLRARGYAWSGMSLHAREDAAVEELVARPVVRPGRRKRPDEMRTLREEGRKSRRVSGDEALSDCDALRGRGMALDPAAYPNDAIAFYRSFHSAPDDEWGIYFDVDRLLAYTESLATAMFGRVRSFDRDSLMTACLAEIFHHEYFHHIVECAATTSEVLLDAAGRGWGLYLIYRLGEHGVPHPHDPLEEALANAYAHNSLSFLAGVKPGVRLVRVRAYQEALVAHWTTEGPGYREARSYVRGGYASGAAALLRQILGSADLPEGAARLVANATLLKGHSTYRVKAAVPTWFCGSKEAVDEFERRVPAPLEAATGLTWFEDLSDAERAFEEERRRRKAKEAS